MNDTLIRDDFIAFILAIIIALPLAIAAYNKYKKSFDLCWKINSDSERMAYIQEIKGMAVPICIGYCLLIVTIVPVLLAIIYYLMGWK